MFVLTEKTTVLLSLNGMTTGVHVYSRANKDEAICAGGIRVLKIGFGSGTRGAVEWKGAAG